MHEATLRGEGAFVLHTHCPDDGYAGCAPSGSSKLSQAVRTSSQCLLKSRRTSLEEQH